MIDPSDSSQMHLYQFAGRDITILFLARQMTLVTTDQSTSLLRECETVFAAMRDAATGRLRGVRVQTEEERQRRLLTRTRNQLMNKKRRVMVRIRMPLHYFGSFPNKIQRRIKLQDIEDILVMLVSARLRDRAQKVGKDRYRFADPIQSNNL